MRIKIADAMSSDAELRRESILNLARLSGRVEVDDLASRFEVSCQTIRADLRSLAKGGVMKRVHGGAEHVTTVTNRNYAERRKLNWEVKDAIGLRTAELIPDDCSISLNIGTTTEQVASALTRHSGLLVLSNNINIINLLAGTNAKQLVMVGGTVRQSDGAVVGDDAVDFISRYKTDIAVIGASALDQDGAVLDFDAREVSVARSILRNSRKRILVSDASKFGISAPVRICGIADLDYFVTDRKPPTDFELAATAGGTTIITLRDKPDNGAARH